MMAESPPAWLNEAFLSTVLQGKNSDTKVEILKYSASPAVPVGNNYLSHLYRVPVDYKVGNDKKSISLIVKKPIESGMFVEMTKDVDLFSVEPKVYEELLPMMEEKINYQFGPKSFYCPLKNGLVLSDLKTEGYVMCDRFEQLDYKHCEKVVINVAKYHATSVACYHDNPSLIQTVGREVFFGENVSFEQEDSTKWVNMWVNKVLEIIEKEDGCQASAQYLTSKTEQLADRKRFVEMFKPKEHGLNVLNHGDLWTNNIMFKHDGSGNIEDVKFIDYQIGRYASPVFDLVYFIWTSCNEDVRENKLKLLLKTYLHTLNVSLEELGCEERLSEKEMLHDFKVSLNYGLLIMLQMLPMIMCEVENVINMEEVSMSDIKEGHGDEQFKKVQDGKYYCALIPKMMRQYHSWVSSLKHDLAVI